MTKGFNFKKWIDAFIGISFYLLWAYAVNALNVFIAYSASIPLFLILLIVLLIWSLFRKSLAGLCGFVMSALAPLCFRGLSTGENKTGTFILAAAFLFCAYELLKSRKAQAKPKEKKLNQKPREWPRQLRWVGLLLILLLSGVRESDLIVSKLYFVPWPIYSDYVYPEGVEKVNFKSLDGTLLNGWYLHGKSPLASKRPVILYVHGNAGNMAAQWFQFEFLMNWGYDVFTFDYRGFGLSEGRPSRVGLWEDTQAAFQEMTALQPGRRYAVVGFSMGAPYSLLLAAHETRISASAFLTCFTSFQEIGIYTLQNWGVPHWLAPVLGRLLVPNGLDAKDFENSKLLPPALFVQGTGDGNVPYAMGEKMANDYTGPKTFLPMPNYPHGDYFKGPMGEIFHQALDRLFAGKVGAP